MITEKEKQAINKLVEGLKKLYGDNLSRLILYGSKARSDAEPDSDIDILVILKKMMHTRYDEISRIVDISSPICLENNILISAIPMEEKWIDTDYKTIFVNNVLNEGMPIAI